MTITAKNLDGYRAPVIDWDRVRTAWLTTINVDGRQHVVPIGIVQREGTWYLTSGPATRRSRNLAVDSRCVLSVATHPFDLVLEGAAHRVTDVDELHSVAEAFADDGWPAKVDGDALTADYSAPSAGPPSWYLYRIAPSTAFAFGTSEPYGATRSDIV